MGKAELNIEVDRPLLEQAAKARARHWAEENRRAIAAHQERLDAHGVFSDDLRTW